jgi:transposase
MAKPYSDDLRERAVAAIESGHTREEVAEFYNLALSAIGGFIKRKRETGIWWPQDICACTAH